jgi:WD40 repeat protein
MRTVWLLAMTVLSFPPAGLFADSHAYVLAPANTPGSITPLDTANGALGAAFFAPAGGYLIAVSPGSKQIWQAVYNVDCACGSAWSLDVLDAGSGSILATFTDLPGLKALVFDAAGRFAYVSLDSGDLVKIDAATLSIVKTTSLGLQHYGGMAFSSDGTILFLAAPGGILVLNPQTLRVVDALPQSGSLLVSGNTLLVSSGVELYYIDTATLQQTNSVALPYDSVAFGVSPDGSRIYLTWNCYCGTASTMEIMDFASGQILVTQTLPDENPSLSPDGSRIVIASNHVLLVDPNTLAVNKTVWTVGFPASVVYLNPNTLLLLNPNTGAMMVIDQASAQVTDSFPLGASPFGEVADPARDLIYTGEYFTEYGPINVVSAALNRTVANLGGVSGFFPAAVAGNRLYVIEEGITGAYSLATGTYAALPLPVIVGPYEHLFTAPGSATPNGKAYWEPFSVHGKTGVIGSGVAVYATATDTVIGGFSASLTALPPVFSPDSSKAYIAGPSNIAVYSTTTLGNIATFHYPTTFIALAVSPDGTLLYATNGEKIFVIDAATGAQQQSYSLPSAVSNVMALSPDGTALFLVEAQFTSSVEMVDTATGLVTVISVPYPASHIVVLP